jgi:hypothetical protein
MYRDMNYLLKMFFSFDFSTNFHISRFQLFKRSKSLYSPEQPQFLIWCCGFFADVRFQCKISKLILLMYPKIVNKHEVCTFV